MIRKKGSKYILYSKDGDKILGTFGSKKLAEKREKQIEYFKHKNNYQFENNYHFDNIKNICNLCKNMF